MEKKILTAPVGIRTCNLSITSPALKPLSCPHFLTTELSPSVSSSRAFCNCLLFFPFFFFFFAVDILVGLTGLMPSCLRRGTGRDRGQFFEEKGKLKQNQTEIILLTSLTPYHQAKPAHIAVDILMSDPIINIMHSRFGRYFKCIYSICWKLNRFPERNSFLFLLVCKQLLKNIVSQLVVSTTPLDLTHQKGALLSCAARSSSLPSWVCSHSPFI